MIRPIVYPNELVSSRPAGRARQLAWAAGAGLAISLLIGASVWALSALIPSRTDWAEIFSGPVLWLYESRIGTGIRESLYAFPIIEGTHLMGIAASAGAVCWFDLRLLGLVLRDQPVSHVWRQLMPWAMGGFAVVFLTGFLLFWAESETAYRSVHFWIKMSLLAAAGVNALVFERIVRRNMAEWDKAPVPPFQARLAGTASLILWTAVIVTGRTMAYNF